VSHRASADSLHAIRRFRQDLAEQRQALADSTANLRAQSVQLVEAAARLKRTGLDLQDGHPPVSILLDNMHNLVFRRTYRETRECSSRPPVLLFYGADVSAMVGHAHRQRQLRIEEWYRRVHPRDRAAYRAAEVDREKLQEATSSSIATSMPSAATTVGRAKLPRPRTTPPPAGACSTATSSTSPSRSRRRRRCG
jgi:hypothetical protein